MPRGPVLTLLAALVLGVVLLGVNMATAGPPATTADAEAAAATAYPGAAQADSAAPDSAAPDSAAPDSAAPDSAAPEGAIPEAPTGAADAPEGFPATARYEGVTAGGRTVPVTIWVDGERAKVYVCDYKGIEVWLQGTARDGVVAATGKNGARLDGRHEGDAVTGDVQVAGYPEWSFTARSR